MDTSTIFENLLENIRGEKKFLLLTDKNCCIQCSLNISFVLNFVHPRDFGLNKYKRCDDRSSKYDKTVIVWFFEK